jgi:GH25 family lysozyme M1 (1,4-beta-N-acetylmuramidase)
MNRANGVDVSAWKPIKDWGALHDAGVTFVGAKATEGSTWIDHTFAAHMKGFRHSQLLLAIYYHFARPGSPRAQAERLLGVVGTLQKNERVALDLEEGGPTEGGAGAIDWLTEFFETVHGHIGQYPLLYTSARIWRMMGNPDWALAPKVDLWLPRWNLTHQPALPKPWATIPDKVQAWAHGMYVDADVVKIDAAKSTITLKYDRNVVTRKLSEENTLWRRSVPRWLIWQWTDGGGPRGDGPDHITPGLGHCDANYFRGDVEALRAYAGGCP